MESDNSAQLQFLPESDDQAHAGGIARLADSAEDAVYRNEVDYKWLDIRSSLNRVDGSRVRFEWSLNPYRGCEFGCKYCYARYAHEFMERDPLDVERRIYLKRHFEGVLMNELRRGRYTPGEEIAIGTATDPYQPAERHYGITRGVLDVLRRFRGFKVSITTKSALVLRDRDLLKRINGRHDLRVNMTITTTDRSLARKTEPRAPTPEARFRALRQLREADIPAGVHIMPILPGLNDFEEEFDRLNDAARRANASFVRWNTLFLTSCSKGCYLPFLRDQFPSLSRLNEDFFRDGSQPPTAYRKEVDAKMSRSLLRHGFLADGSVRRTVNDSDQQSKKGLAGASQLDIFDTAVNVSTP